MTDQSEASKRANTALVELIAFGQVVQAAVVRGASPEEIENLRQGGIATAEAFMDRTIEAAKAARAIIDGHPDASKLGAEGAKRLLD